MNDSPSHLPPGPYAGYQSIAEAIDDLRRARFAVRHRFRLTSRGVVVAGEILEGAVSAGMVLLPVLASHPNILTPLVIRSVEALTNEDFPVGLVFGDEVQTDWDALELSPGTVVDVLARSPAPAA